MATTPDLGLLMHRSMAHQMIKGCQEADPDAGALFKALYEFGKRTQDELWRNDQKMPRAILSLYSQDDGMRGWYLPKDEMFLTDRINLNITVLRNGAEAAETLAHEMMHQRLWHASGGDSAATDHGDMFQEYMQLKMGIDCNASGYHVGYIGNKWQSWMEFNEDLELDQFLLPGAE